MSRNNQRCFSTTRWWTQTEKLDNDSNDRVERVDGLNLGERGAGWLNLTDSDLVGRTGVIGKSGEDLLTKEINSRQHAK
jgi:hypothetical protein